MRPVLWIERNFHRARVPITFLFPGNVAAMLAGADGMPPALFFAVALGSIELRVWAVRVLANAFRGTLLQVLEWVGDNQIWLTVISVGGVMGWVMWSNRHGITQGETIEEIIEDFEPDDGPRSRGDGTAQRASRNRSGASAPATTSAIIEPTSGENLKPWPEHGDATTTGPTRSMTKSSVGVVV